VDLAKGKRVRLASYDIGAARSGGRWRLAFERTAEVPPEWHYERLGTVFILSDCPSRCIMCSVRKLYDRALTPLPTVFRVLEEFRLCGYTRIDYFGGEPTLRDDLPDIIFCATCLDCYSDIITNGIPLTPAVAEKLARAGLSLAMVSLDAPDEELHDRIRGFPGGYAKALQGLRAILAQPGVEVNIDTVVLPENYRMMARQAELAARLGATHINFFFCVCGPIAAPRPMWLSEEQLTEFHQAVLPEIRRITKEHGITFTLSPELPEEGAEPHIKRISRGTYNAFFETKDVCAGPLDEVYVTLKGEVFPCTSPTILETEHVVGNIFEQSLIEIVAGERMQAFRQAAGHVEACRMCFRCHVVPRIERRYEDARENLKEKLREERKRR
jgi:radical SAM protein with 4Fe4S-binding SPASM domain